MELFGAQIALKYPNMRVRLGLFASNPPKQLSTTRDAYRGYLRWGPLEKCFFSRTGSRSCSPPHSSPSHSPPALGLPLVPQTRTTADLATRASPPPGIRAAASPQPRRRLPSMDGDGFNAWGSQPSASCPGHAPASLADLDLNSQAPAVEVFPVLGLYGAVL